ncbi:hypothetical protein ACQKIW_32105 [Bacillus thuringiensis]|uniref:hypothetical protein n=1 Tax=Bacillus thuringiensis TaxID=1428 RepID=UPI003D03DD97
MKDTEHLYDLNLENINQFKEPLTFLQRKNAVPYIINFYQSIRPANMVANIKQVVANQEVWKVRIICNDYKFTIEAKRNYIFVNIGCSYSFLL